MTEEHYCPDCKMTLHGRRTRDEHFACMHGMSMPTIDTSFCEQEGRRPGERAVTHSLRWGHRGWGATATRVTEDVGTSPDYQLPPRAANAEVLGGQTKNIRCEQCGFINERCMSTTSGQFQRRWRPSSSLSSMRSALASMSTGSRSWKVSGQPWSQSMTADLCWTSLVGAPTHNLGDLPEKCFTCAAKRREASAKGVEVLTRLMSGMSRPLKDGERHMPLPSTAAEWKAQGFTYAERDSESRVGQD